MPLKVSVIVPVYNPGGYIEACVDSILGQSMPPDEYEAIFVDDGSTDGTPARLDRLAAEHRNIRVIHIPNSGWPGRPRNVGIDAATGEFVQFLDHDDSLGREALRRLYDFGVAHGADVVVGKMAGQGRAVPRELFRVNRPRARLGNAPLIDSLTPHKMFRRAFLMDTGLRFPEGRRRLEDHVFVVEAYLRAANVSVLSDYVCYVHTRRTDTGNAGLRPFDPARYYANLREALDVVERYTEPGPLRDKLYRRWFRAEMIERLRGRRMLAWPADFRADLFAQIRQVAVERFGPGVVNGLQPIQQVVGALIMADLPDDVLALARWEARLSGSAYLRDVRWVDGTLRIACDAELSVDGAPLAFRRTGDVVVLDPPLSARGQAAVAAAGVSIVARSDQARADVLLCRLGSPADFFVPIVSEREYVGPDDGLVLKLRTLATIDPGTVASGGPLPAGIWDLHVSVSSNGWTRELQPGAARGGDLPELLDAAVLGEPPRVVVPFWTDGRRSLALDVDQQTDRLAVLLDALPAGSAEVSDHRLRVQLPLHVTAATTALVRYSGPRPEASEGTDGVLDAGGALTAGLPATGKAGSLAGIDVALAPGAGGSTRFVALGLALLSRPVAAPTAVRRRWYVARRTRRVLHRRARRAGWLLNRWLRRRYRSWTLATEHRFRSSERRTITRRHDVHPLHRQEDGPPARR